MSLAADLRAIEARVAAFDDAVASAPAPRPAAFAAAVRTNVAEIVRREAGRAGVDPALLLAVARTESGLDPGATSAAGARGVMQLMPETARQLGVDDPYDPVENVRGGAGYLHDLLDRFRGDVRSAVAAFRSA